MWWILEFQQKPDKLIQMPNCFCNLLGIKKLRTILQRGFLDAWDTFLILQFCTSGLLPVLQSVRKTSQLRIALNSDSLSTALLSRSQRVRIGSYFGLSWSRNVRFCIPTPQSFATLSRIILGQMQLTTMLLALQLTSKQLC